MLRSTCITAIIVIVVLCLLDRHISTVGHSLDEQQDALIFEQFQNIPWRAKTKYYYEDLRLKVNEMVQPSCRASIRFAAVDQVAIPHDDSVVSVTPLTIDDTTMRWWRSFDRPVQMRVDPLLCKAVYLKKTPIFDQPSCQLKTYMHPSAPRCQTKYLKWLCETTQLDINDDRPNYAIMPEAHHNRTFLPPQPYILTIRNAYVMMCGQVIANCGAIRTTANCQSNGQVMFMGPFQQACSMQQLSSVRTIITAVLILLSLW